MTSKYIKQQLVPRLKNLLSSIDSIEQKCVSKLESIKGDNPIWLEENDFRPGTYSRFISSLVAVKFTASEILDFLNSEGWEDRFKAFIPTPWKQTEYYGHFTEIALLIRFFLFHSVYSSIEATHRLIISNKNLRTNGKPAEIVTELTGTYPADDIKFYDFIRNTIHNNGYHHPKNENNNHWTYNFKDKTYAFNVGERIDLELTDILNIIDDQIDKMIATLEHEEIYSMEIIEDKS